MSEGPDADGEVAAEASRRSTPRDAAEVSRRSATRNAEGAEGDLDAFGGPAEPGGRRAVPVSGAQNGMSSSPKSPPKSSPPPPPPPPP
ncbi:MAG: hypothetical protein CMN30_12400 [Sandaracinus sp.]|nr:hypothetical protein [Sandaracinus sp.]